MPGPPTLTPAIVVGAIRYGETSRIVRLATRELGVLGAIARGAMRPGSRVGRTLNLLAEGTAHVILGRGELATLAAFDLTDAHLALAKSLPAFHAANALAELVARFVPPIPQEEPYLALRHGIAMLEAAPEEVIDAVALTALWQLVAHLGVPPALDSCTRDGTAVAPGPAVFSVADGGVLCPRCAVGHAAARLETDDRAALAFFLGGVGEPPLLDPRHLAAHRRLLVRWVAHHLGEVELPALELWRQGR